MVVCPSYASSGNDGISLQVLDASNFQRTVTWSNYWYVDFYRVGSSMWSSLQYPSSLVNYYTAPTDLYQSNHIAEYNPGMGTTSNPISNVHFASDNTGYVDFTVDVSFDNVIVHVDSGGAAFLWWLTRQLDFNTALQHLSITPPYILINGEEVSSDYEYTSPSPINVTSYGLRWYYKDADIVSASADTLTGLSLFCEVFDYSVWVFEEVSLGTVITVIDSNFTKLEATINDGVEKLEAALADSTNKTTQAIQTASGQIVAAVSSTPAQNQAASDFTNEMGELTGNIKDNVGKIESGHQRPDPDDIKQQVDPLEKLDPTDDTYMTMKNGLADLLGSEYILTLLLMVAGFAFIGYVFFGKRT